MKFSTTGLVLGLVLSSGATFGMDEPSELTKEYMSVFSRDSASQEQLHVLNQLQWSGLSDPRLFDLVEQRLQELYPIARGKDVELASWYAKSLGTSGLDKYRTTLQAIIDSKANGKIRKYAGEGLNNISRYSGWNPTISSIESARPDKSEQINAFANMLRSDDWWLRNMAAKRIYSDKVYDDYLLGVLEEALKKEYVVDHTANLQIQTTAWMARALSSSRMPEYKPTIQDMADHAPSSKLRSYARKYLKNF